MTSISWTALYREVGIADVSVKHGQTFQHAVVFWMHSMTDYLLVAQARVFLDALPGAPAELLNSTHFGLGSNSTHAMILHHHQVMYL